MNKRNADKPTVLNTACLMRPMHSRYDGAADELRHQVMTMEDSPVHCSRCWYISNTGNDENRGDSPEQAWATIAGMQAHEDAIGEGDAVLFERGGVFRGHIVARSGVTYAAYGSGDKPCIYGSRQNYADAAWQSVGENVWCMDLPADAADVGIMVFNHGEDVGFKKPKQTDLINDGDFCCDEAHVWLKMHTNPSDVYDSIEIGELFHLFLMTQGTHDVTIENLTLKYTGGMAVEGITDVWNITVRGCEMGWLGGSLLPGYKDGNVRFGNGIEFWRGCRQVLIEYCWIYQIYDTGFSHQGRGEFDVEDLVFRCNLVEYTAFASIEFWAPVKAINTMRRIRYEDNILRFAGYSWGADQRHDFQSVHICTTGSDNVCQDFVIRNNILDTAAGKLLGCCFNAGEAPVLDGNTYAQTPCGQLGYFIKNGNNTCYVFNERAGEFIRDSFGDEHATVEFSETVAIPT